MYGGHYSIRACDKCGAPIPFTEMNALGFFYAKEGKILHTGRRVDGQDICSDCDEKERETYYKGRYILETRVGCSYLVEKVGDQYIGFLIDIDEEKFADYYAGDGEVGIQEAMVYQEMLDFGRAYLKLSYSNIQTHRLPKFDGTYEDIHDIAAPINTQYGQ